MELGLGALYAFLDTCQTDTLTLATVIRTEGASYRKAGAMMLIDANMNTSGLVSGGCLEDDLKVHAEAVFASGLPTIIEYDLSQEEAASMWGLGLGCGGRIEVLLERISTSNGFGGLAALRTPYFDGRAVVLRKVVRAPSPESVGAYELDLANTSDAPLEDSVPGEAAVTRIDGNIETLCIPVSPVRRLLVCGAGPDAIPLVHQAAGLSWQVHVTDPRPAYLNDDHFPSATKLHCTQPDALAFDRIGPLQAAVIMTHNVERDCSWLTRLYEQPIPYIGLLGPVNRRDMLLERAGLVMDPRLHGPAGLDIGAALPEEIALSIIAQIHAVLGRRSGGYLSDISTVS